MKGCGKRKGKSACKVNGGRSGREEKVSRCDGGSISAVLTGEVGNEVSRVGPSQNIVGNWSGSLEGIIRGWLCMESWYSELPGTGRLQTPRKTTVAV